MLNKGLLIVGIFWSKKTRNKIPRSAPCQLAELLSDKGTPVVKTSVYLNRLPRLFDTFITTFFQRKKYDVAIIPWFNGGGSFVWQELSSKMVKLLGKKLVLVMHGGGIPDLIDQNPARYLKSLKRADLVVCPSSFFIERLEKYNLPTTLIENSLDLELYPFIKKERFNLSILWMRTLEDIYNPEMALEVARIIKQKNYPFTLYIAGKDNGSLHRLKTLCKEWDLENEVVFSGFLNHEEKIELSKKCDFYICTNKIDNAPVSLIEMMALGLPVISTNVGGIPYFIKDHQNGCLVNSDDAAAMAERLIEIHLSPSLGQKLAINGYYFSRQFDQSRVVEKWNSNLQDLTNGPYETERRKSKVLPQSVQPVITEEPQKQFSKVH